MQVRVQCLLTKREYTGELLYHYLYPRALEDSESRTYFVTANQRLGLQCDGYTQHFTVHFRVLKSA